MGSWNRLRSSWTGVTTERGRQLARVSKTLAIVAQRGICDEPADLRAAARGTRVLDQLLACGVECRDVREHQVIEAGESAPAPTIVHEHRIDRHTIELGDDARELHR